MKGSRFVLAVFILLASCGDPRTRPDRSAGPSPRASLSPSVVASVAPVDPRDSGFEIGFGEYAVVLEATAVRPGPIEFRVRNGGKLTHGFEIQAEGADNSGSGSGRGFKHESETVAPGETISVRLDLPVGVYEIECFVDNHDDLGMRARLEVREDAPLIIPTPNEGSGIAIKGFSFTPMELKVKVGTSVRWMNEDPAQHTATSETGVFDSGALRQDGSFEFSFASAGRYPYFCKIHPEMKGAVSAE